MQLYVYAAGVTLMNISFIRPSIDVSIAGGARLLHVRTRATPNPLSLHPTLSYLASTWSSEEDQIKHSVRRRRWSRNARQAFANQRCFRK